MQFTFRSGTSFISIIITTIALILNNFFEFSLFTIRQSLFYI